MISKTNQFFARSASFCTTVKVGRADDKKAIPRTTSEAKLVVKNKITHTFYIMAHKFTNIFASRIQSRYSKSRQGRRQIGWQIQLGVLRRYFVDCECEVLRESPIETGLTGDLKSVCRFVGHCAILNGLGFSYKLQKISFLVLLCRSHEPNPQQGRRKVQKNGEK